MAKDKPDLLRPIQKKRRTPTGPPQPAPEVVDGGEWNVRQSPSVRVAGVQLNPSGPGGNLVAPFGEAEQGRLVRAHELTHIHITPRDWPRPYRDDLMNLLEDGRVHRHMQTTGFDLSGLSEVFEEAELKPEKLGELHPAILTSLAIAALDTGESQRVYDAFKSIGRSDLYELAHQLGRHCYPPNSRPTVDDLGNLADFVIRAVGDPDEPEPEPEIEPEPEPEPGEEPAPPPPPAPPPVVKIQKFGTDMRGWGDMEIVQVPLSRRLPGKMRGYRRLVPDTRGRRLRRVGRLATDGKVFGNRIPVPGGGAVLIDCSGSMDITDQQVERIVQALPGGIVATYAGGGEGKTRGWLRIVAKNGRYCAIEDIRPAGRANVIDGPALEWLAAQRGPRYWVSDGKVTGIGEQQSPLLVKEAEKICRQGQIRRVRDVNTLIE